MSAAPILMILKDGETIKRQPLEGEVLLGRSEGCVIRLEDRAISRQHAVFRSVPGGVQVEKKSEVAPLAVNGTECTTAVVKEGDVIAIGPYLVKLSLSGEEGSPSTLALDPPPGAQADPRASESPVQDRGSLELVPQDQAGAGAGAPIDLDSSQPQESNEDEPLSVEQGDSGDGIASEFEVPQFSMNAPVPEQSAPLDLGEISIDEEGATKLVAPAKVSAKLVFPEGVANVTEFEVDKDEVSIGRGKDCDIVLDDKKTSRKHAIIRRSGVNFSLKDLGSANGTYVNGVKIEEQELSGDDILRIGNVEFRFLVLSADYAKNQDAFMPVPPESSAPSIDFPQDVSAPAQDFGGQSLAEMAPAPALSAQTQSETLGAGPGLAGIPGIAGMPKGRQSLIEKYRALPPRRKAIWTVVIIAAVYFGLFDGNSQKAQPKHPKTVVSAGKNAKTATFESLTPQQQKFVETQHALAFDYYKNRDYDKALFEIEKIFALIPDYKDSREIERYAREGKRKIEELEQEKRKKEEEAKIEQQISDLVAQAKVFMDKKDFDGAKNLFPQILSLDPDNQQVAAWQKQVEQYQENQRIQAEEKSVRDQINMRAWDLYHEGLGLKKKGHYHQAIATFGQVANIGAPDKKPQQLASYQIHATEELIARRRDPILERAKEAEDNGDLTKAYNLYKKATLVDPQYPVGYAGMDRIRGILHERAKALYIDAVLSESYSDFDTAKKKYEQCMKVAPKDDEYYARAERKLAQFFDPAQAQSGQGDSGDSGPSGD